MLPTGHPATLMKHRSSLSGVLAFAFAALVLLPSAVVHGQVTEERPADSLVSLDDLLVEARLNNPSLRAAFLNATALATRRDQVSKLPDPTFGFSWQPYPIYTARGTQRTQFRLEQMFPFPGVQNLRGDIADRDTEAAYFRAQASRLDLEFQVKQAYFELYRIQQLLDLVHTFQATLEDFEESANRQYVVGTGSQQAVLKAQLEKNSLESIKIDLEKSRTSYAETLARLLNRSSASGFLGNLRAEAPPIPTLDEDVILTTALIMRPELGAVDAEAGRADAQISLAKRRYWPDFGLNITYFDIAANEQLPMGSGTDALAIGAKIKVPLQLGRRGATVEEAKVRRSQVEARREALESEFRTQIADLVNQVKQEEQQLRLFGEVLIPQAEVTLQATLSDYTTGRTDFLNLLDAERMLFSLHNSYENVFVRYLKVRAALERAAGVSSFVEQSRGE